MKPIGYFVVEHAEEFEQPLRLLHGDVLPRDGVLDWGAPVALFSDRKSARDAITRTEHYRLAFNNTQLPERKYCKIVPVAAVPGSKLDPT